MERLRGMQSPDRILPSPIAIGADGEACRPGVHCTAVDAPAMLIWFPPVKSGKLCPDCAMGHCQGEHVAGNMRGVLHVRAQRGAGISGSRCARVVTHGPQCGITARSCVESEEAFLLYARVIQRRP